MVCTSLTPRTARRYISAYTLVNKGVVSGVEAMPALLHFGLLQGGHGFGV